MARTFISKETFNSLSETEREDLITPAKYFASRYPGEKKWYVFSQIREGNKTFDKEVGGKGFLTMEKAKAFAEQMQEKETASIEKMTVLLEKYGYLTPA